MLQARFQTLYSTFFELFLWLIGRFDIDDLVNNSGGLMLLFVLLVLVWLVILYHNSVYIYIYIHSGGLVLC